MMEVFLLIISIILLIVFLVLAYDHIFVGSVPFISIPEPTLKEIIDLCKIEKHSVVYDLGCGDGRTLISINKKHPTTKLIGIEKAVLPFIIAKLKTREYPNITIKFGDITQQKYPEKSTFFLYLLPELLLKISVVLPKKSNIISVHYKIPSKKPAQTIKLKTPSKLISSVHFY